MNLHVLKMCPAELKDSHEGHFFQSVNQINILTQYIVALAQDCSNSIFDHFDNFAKTDRKISNTSVQ